MSFCQKTKKNQHHQQQQYGDSERYHQTCLIEDNLMNYIL